MLSHWASRALGRSPAGWGRLGLAVSSLPSMPMKAELGISSRKGALEPRHSRSLTGLEVALTELPEHAAESWAQ